MIKQTLQNNLTRYISFHAHPHASFYNTIEGIVSSEDIYKSIKNIMTLLNKDFIVLEYSEDIEDEGFLKRFASALENGKTILILTDTLQFSPFVYDQLMRFRDSNKLEIKLLNTATREEKNISPQANVFLLYKNVKLKDNISEIYSIADHVLDVRREII